MNIKRTKQFINLMLSKFSKYPSMQENSLSENVEFSHCLKAHLFVGKQFMRQVVHKGAVKDAIWSYFKKTSIQKGLREMKCENRQVGNVEQ